MEDTRERYLENLRKRKILKEKENYQYKDQTSTSAAKAVRGSFPLPESKSPSKDTRNSALKDLDFEADTINKALSRKKGSFNSKKERDGEDEVEKNIESSELPENRKKEYLQVLRKRMRTS